MKDKESLVSILDDVADDLTDEQIDKFTDMILDLRDKVKAVGVVGAAKEAVGVAKEKGQAGQAVLLSGSKSVVDQGVQVLSTKNSTICLSLRRSNHNKYIILYH